MIKQLGHPKVRNLCSERLSKQNIASIEVTMHDVVGVEVGQAIGHISEDAGFIRERDVGVCLHAVIKVHVHVLHDETDVCLVVIGTIDSHELDYARMAETAQ